MVDRFIETVIGGLFLAWILTFFHFDKICIEAIQPLVSFVLTKSHYYFGFVGICVLCLIISEFIKAYRKRHRN